MPTKTVTAREAMKRVLTRAGQPRPVKTITERAARMKGVTLKGATPEATMTAVLYTDAAKPTGDFIKTGRGMIGLRGRDD